MREREGDRTEEMKEIERERERHEGGGTKKKWREKE